MQVTESKEGTTSTSPKETTRKTAKAPKHFVKIAKGYKSPLAKAWPDLVDYKSTSYAFLEVEQRDYDGKTGIKLSKPRVVSYNRSDLVQFLGKKFEKTVNGEKESHWAIHSQKLVQGLSVNAVLYIPTKFGLDVEVDQWNK